MTKQHDPNLVPWALSVAGALAAGSGGWLFSKAMNLRATRVPCPDLYGPCIGPTNSTDYFAEVGMIAGMMVVAGVLGWLLGRWLERRRDGE